MTLRLFKNPYKAKMEKAACAFLPETREQEEMLKRIITSVGVTAGGLTALSASARLAALAQGAAMLKVGGAAVTALAIVGTAAAVSLLNPVHIQNLSASGGENLSASAIVVTTDSYLPARSIRAVAEDGALYGASFVKPGAYVVETRHNGLYTVEVVSTNGALSSADIAVTNIDDTYPVMTGYDIEGGTVRIRFTDEGAGVNWNSLAARDANGVSVAPLAVEEEAGFALFPQGAGDLSVQIADKAENEIVATVRAQASAASSSRATRSSTQSGCKRA
jgi:hypothetical protein